MLLEGKDLYLNRVKVSILEGMLFRKTTASMPPIPMMSDSEDSSHVLH